MNLHYFAPSYSNPTLTIDLLSNEQVDDVKVEQRSHDSSAVLVIRCGDKRLRIEASPEAMEQIGRAIYFHKRPDPVPADVSNLRVPTFIPPSDV